MLKKVYIIVFIILFIFLVSFSGCKANTSNAEKLVNESSREEVAGAKNETGGPGSEIDLGSEVMADSSLQLKEAVNLKTPTLKLSIYKGPEYAQDGTICFYRIKATVTGKPKPQIIFNRDNSNSAWGKNIAQVNLKEGESYTLTCEATNSAGKASGSITLNWVSSQGDQGNSIDFSDSKNFSIDVDLTKQLVTIYYKSDILKQTVCSGGTAKDPTPVGTFTTNQKIYYSWVSKFNEGAFYWVRFYGPYLFHSVPFDKNGNMIAEENNKLGTPASHGCVRLKLEEARWLYDNLPLGVKVVIHK
jgi:lipoprotein-anchoring transpeptidase ErfK/SrfK